MFSNLNSSIETAEDLSKFLAALPREQWPEALNAWRMAMWETVQTSALESVRSESDRIRGLADERWRAEVMLLRQQRDAFQALSSLLNSRVRDLDLENHALKVRAAQAPKR